MLEKIKAFIKKTGTGFGDMWSYLQFALKEDKADKERCAANGVLVPSPDANLKLWFTHYGVAAVGIFLLLVMLLYMAIKGKSPAKRSHHGYNRDGNRY